MPLMLYFEDAGITIYNYISYIIDIYKSEEDEVKSKIFKLISLQKRHCSNAVSILNCTIQSFKRLLFKVAINCI